MLPLFDPHTAFIFANALDLAVALAVTAILLAYLVGRIQGFADLRRRVSKMLNRDFQGGAYDLAVAMTVIFIGKAIRTEAAWEWRFFEGELSRGRLFLGVLLSAIGALCLVRILAPNRWFNAIWMTVAIVAAAFASFTAFG